jgi:hypothetical protein
MPITPRMRRRWLLFLLLIGLAIFASARLHLWPFNGLFVVVKNLGPKPLKDVAVHVTGIAYRLGDLGVGDSRPAKIEPRGESHVEIEFSDEAKGRFKHVIGGNFDPSNARGTLTVEFENGTIQRVDNQITNGS